MSLESAIKELQGFETLHYERIFELVDVVMAERPEQEIRTTTTTRKRVVGFHPCEVNKGVERAFKGSRDLGNVNVTADYDRIEVEASDDVNADISRAKEIFRKKVSSSHHVIYKWNKLVEETKTSITENPDYAVWREKYEQIPEGVWAFFAE
jgi:hypothetical protein